MSESPQKDEPVSLRDKLILVIVVPVMIGIIVVPILVLTLRKDAPQYEHVRGLVSDVRADRYDSAYGRMEADFRRQVSFERFRTVLEQERVFHEAEDCVLRYHSVSDRTDAVECTLEQPSGPVELTFLVRREMTGSTWWIVLLRVDGREPFGADMGNE